MHAYAFVFWNQLYARMDMIQFPGFVVYIDHNMKQEINPNP